MPIIDKYGALNRAFQAIRNIDSLATDLDNQSGPIEFNALAGRLDSMRQSYLSGVQPVLDLGAATPVNNIVGTFFAGSLPANTYTQFQAVGTALTALYTAYDIIFETLTPIVHTPAAGHSYASIPLAQLSDLADELDAVLAAVAPLR